jgi:hypothetical protein
MDCDGRAGGTGGVVLAEHLLEHLADRFEPRLHGSLGNSGTHVVMFPERVRTGRW